MTPYSWRKRPIRPAAPSPLRPSGSTIRKAKLFVPAGAFDQLKAGETFSPTQLAPRIIGATPPNTPITWWGVIGGETAVFLFARRLALHPSRFNSPLAK